VGRQLRRVPLDFDWPLNEVWRGFVNPHCADAADCAACGGMGYSPDARRLTDEWYGNAPFDPRSRGSEPFLPTNDAVLRIARRNVERSPWYYGSGGCSIAREAARLCDHFNAAWCHHLGADDVAALIAAGRLLDLTHDWTPEGGWREKIPPVAPTPRQVNEWSLLGMGHDSINQWTCVRAACGRLGVPSTCAACDGEGTMWPSPETRRRCEEWRPTEPLEGPGYQVWETVSEGSPISPVFSTARDLAHHMATTRYGADRGTSYEDWVSFIEGPGWAPSMAVLSGEMMPGVVAMAQAGEVSPCSADAP
jgi:hypothetical protein